METEMKSLALNITTWLDTYLTKSGLDCFVVGVSGGVDSGLVSTLCAMTNRKVIVLNLPCQSKPINTANAQRMCDWLCETFQNVEQATLDLTDMFAAFSKQLPVMFQNNLGFANTKSRLRMTALYQVATACRGLVVGTGNKIEDFGVFFYTKYGDGGVDISPIADLMKSEVRQMAREIGVPAFVCEAVPTDGLWLDNRTDEDALGATYDELEWAMKYFGELRNLEKDPSLTDRQKEVLAIYETRHTAGLHKALPIPTFKRNAQ